MSESNTITVDRNLFNRALEACVEIMKVAHDVEMMPRETLFPPCPKTILISRARQVCGLINDMHANSYKAAESKGGIPLDVGKALFALSEDIEDLKTEFEALRVQNAKALELLNRKPQQVSGVGALAGVEQIEAEISRKVRMHLDNGAYRCQPGCNAEDHHHGGYIGE